MQIRSELEGRIASIKLQIEEQKERAKDFVDDPASVQAAKQRLKELHVRLTQLERNLDCLTKP